ncbi:hypothetical protein HKD37_05G012581 [Glycine soja]
MLLEMLSDTRVFSNVKFVNCVDPFHEIKDPIDSRSRGSGTDNTSSRGGTGRYGGRGGANQFSNNDFEGHIIVPVWVAIEVVEIDLLVVMVDADTNKCTCESVGQLHPQEIINSFV